MTKTRYVITLQLDVDENWKLQHIHFVKMEGTDYD